MRNQRMRRNTARRTKKAPKGNDGLGFWQVSPFKPFLTTTFKYASLSNMLEAAVGSGVQYLWNLNSLYDPDGTSVGHQPLYFDQLLTAGGPYSRYVVYKTKVKITVTNISANPVMFAIYLQAGTIDFPSRETLAEKPMCKKVFLPQSGGGPVTRSITLNVPIHKVFGIPRVRVMNDDVYVGMYNSNPSQVAYGVAMMYSQPGAGVVAQVSVATELEFFARVFGRTAVSGS